MRAAGRPQSAPGQRRSGTARSRARPVGRVALEGNATALVRAVPRCSPPGPAVAHAVVPGRCSPAIPVTSCRCRASMARGTCCPGRGPRIRHLLAASGGTQPVPLRLTGCGDLGKCPRPRHSRGHRRHLHRSTTPRSHAGRTDHRTAPRHRRPTQPCRPARVRDVLQIRLQVGSDEAVHQARGILKAPEPAGQGPSAAVGDTGIEPVTSSV